DHAGVRVRDQEHVGLLDLLEAADRGPVEAVAVLEPLFGEFVSRCREVLHEPGEVAETEVDNLDALLLNQPNDVARSALLHAVNLHLKARTQAAQPNETFRAAQYRAGAWSRAISHPFPEDERSVKRAGGRG